MSTSIDDRIVRMQFDNSGFLEGATKAIETLDKLKGALNIDYAKTGLDKVRNILSRFSFKPVDDGLDAVKQGFTALNAMSFGFFSNFGKKMSDFVMSLPKRMTAFASDGFNEYQQQMTSIQTISANSGESLEVIKKNLDELNEYADKTTYVFSDMTSAIGRFTAAGIEVGPATTAIKGFFNAAALGGANAEAASRGVYQLSQAMSAGVVKLQDWRSIENASSDTAQFRDVIVATARHMGAAVDDAIAKEGSFRASLSKDWLTADIMQEALENMTYSLLDYEDAQKGEIELVKKLTEKGYSEEVAKQIIQTATAADSSARTIRRWNQLIDSVKESIGSGWAKSWEILVGDFNESSEFFSFVGDKIGDFVGKIADARNAFLKTFKDAGGRSSAIDAIANILVGLISHAEALGKAFSTVFKISAKNIALAFNKFAAFTDGFVLAGDKAKTFQDVVVKALRVVRNAFRIVRIIGTFASGLLDPIITKIRGFISATLPGAFTYIVSFANRLRRVVQLLLIGPLNKWSDKTFRKILNDPLFDILGTIYVVINNAVELFRIFFKRVSTYAESAVNVFLTLWPYVSSIITSYVRVFSAVAKIAWSVIRVVIAVVRTIWTVLTPVRAVVGIVIKTLVSLIAGVMDKVSRVYGKIADIVYKAADIFVRMTKPIRRIIKEIYTTFYRVFKAIYLVITHSQLYKTVSKMFSNIKKTISDFITNLIPSDAKLPHTIAWYFIHPFKALKDILVSFNKEHRVQYFMDSIRTIFSTLTGPFKWAFDVASKVVKWFYNNALKPLGSWLGLTASSVDEVKGSLKGGIGDIFSETFSKWEESIKNFLSNHGISFDLSKFFESITQFDFSSALSSFNIDFGKFFEPITSFKFGDLFKDFKVPTFITDGLDFLSSKFKKVSKYAKKAKDGVDKFVKGSDKIDKREKTSKGGLFSGITDRISMLIEYFKNLGKSGKSFPQIIGTIFGDVYNSVKTWFANFATTGDGFLQALSGFISKLMEKAQEIGTKISEFLLGAPEKAKEEVSKKTDEIKKQTEETGKSIGDYFQQMLSNLPTIEDITNTIGGFFTNVKNTIVEQFGKKLANGGKEGTDTGQLKSSLGDLFDFSGFKITLPEFDIVGAISGFFEDLNAAMDKIPTDKINEKFGWLEEKFKGLATAVGIVSGINWVNSLATLNRGLGKGGKAIDKSSKTLETFFGKGIGDAAERFGKGLTGGLTLGNIGQGLTEIGKGLKGFASDTVKLIKPHWSKSLVRVATAMALLASSMWLVAQIPAEKLETVGYALAGLALGAVALMGALVVINNMSQGFIEELGKGFMFLGIGVAALSVALYVVANTDFSKYKGSVIALIAIVGTLLIGMAYLASVANTEKMTGVGICMLALAIAVNLLIFPILLMGYLWKSHQDILGNGIFIVGCIIGFFVLLIWGLDKLLQGMTKINFTQLGIFVLAMAAAIVILTGAIFALGVMGDAAVKGLGALFVVMLLMGAFIAFADYWVGDSKRLVGVGAAMILIAVAMSIMLTALIPLGTLADTAKAGLAPMFGVFVIIGLFMRLVLSEMSGKAGAMVAASASMILLSVVIAALSVVLVALGAAVKYLGFLNGVGALALMLGLVGIIAVMAMVVRTFEDISVLAIAKAIITSVALTALIGVMAAIAIALAAAASVLPGALVSIGMMVVLFAGLAALMFVSQYAGLGILAMAAAVGVLAAAFAGLAWTLHTFPDECAAIVNGITALFGWIGDAGAALIKAFTGGVDSEGLFGSPSQLMEQYGEWSIEGFVNGILGNLGLVDESGQFTVDGLMDKLKQAIGLSNETGEETSGSFLDGLSGMISGALGLGEDTEGGLLEGLASLPTTMAEKAGEAVDSFITSIDTEGIKQTGIDIASGILDGLTSKVWDDIKAWPGKLFSSIWEGIRNQFIIQSPSEKMIELGGFIAEGLWEGLTNWIEPLASKASELGNAIMNGIGEAKDWITTKFGEGLDAAKQKMDEWKIPFQAGGAGLADSTVIGAGAITSGFGTVMKGAKDAWNAALGETGGSKKAIAGVNTAVNSEAVKVQGMMKTGGSKGSSQYAAGIRSGVTTVRNAAQAMTAAARKNVDLYKPYYSTGRNASLGLAHGMDSALGQVRAAAARIIAEADKASKKKAEVNSPSKLFMRTGGSIGEGLVMGMEAWESKVAKSGAALISIIPNSFVDTLSSMSIDIDDLLETEYNPEITPVINPAQFNYGLDQLSNAMNNRTIGSFNIGSLNYNGELAAKLSDNMDLNQQAMDIISRNGIDYDRLGVSVANALIASGVHVELDGGEFMGYLAGEIRDVRRQFA